MRVHVLLTAASFLSLVALPGLAWAQVVSNESACLTDADCPEGLVCQKMVDASDCAQPCEAEVIYGCVSDGDSTGGLPGPMTKYYTSFGCGGTTFTCAATGLDAGALAALLLVPVLRARRRSSRP